MSSLFEIAASEAIAAIRMRKLSVVEYVECFLDRIAETDGRIGAWAHLRPELARDAARALDARRDRGEDLDRLWGMPVGVKDVINTADLPTEMGSAIWKGFTPGNDARVVASILLNNGLVLGKTVTAEFAVHHNDRTVNPHHGAYSPGTSSSGSAAAVASGQVPLALGTQTAASIIRPASFCGVFGFKPSFGLIPRTGILKTLDTLDHVGVFGRTPADLRLMFDACRVHGLNYPIGDAILSNPNEQEKSSGRSWRILALQCPAYQNAADSHREAFDAWCGRLAGTAGFVVESHTLPESLRCVHELHATVYNRSLAYYFAEEYDTHRDLLSPVFRALVEEGNRIPVTVYQAAVAGQNDMERIADEELADRFDAIVTLATAGPAPRGLATPERPDSGLIWTFCRMPSLTAPVFCDGDGMPFGLQIVTRRYRDYRLLHILRELADKELVPARSKIAAFPPRMDG